LYDPTQDTTPSILLGDVNGDQKINIQDATIVLRFVVSLAALTDQQNVASDLNGDGKINVQDAVLLLRKIVGL
jgi:hypothetical protein